MPSKRKTKNDFRSRRWSLPKEAFAIAPKKEPRASDVIDRETWSSIVSLPDDVAWRTSDFHGSIFHKSHEFWGYWISLVLDLQSLTEKPSDDALCIAALQVTDELQASIYTALTGFYRQAIAGLRLALEGVVAGAYFRSYSDAKWFVQWADGHEEGQLWMKDLRAKLSATDPYQQFETGRDDERLMSKAGWVNFLYSRLSKFQHGRPYFIDEDGNQIPTSNVGLWGGSNGPVYESRSVNMWSAYYFDTLLCCLALVGMAEPRIPSLARPTDLDFREFVIHVVNAKRGLHPGALKPIAYLTGKP